MIVLSCKADLYKWKVHSCVEHTPKRNCMLW